MTFIRGYNNVLLSLCHTESALMHMSSRERQTGHSFPYGFSIWIFLSFPLLSSNNSKIQHSISFRDISKIAFSMGISVVCFEDRLHNPIIACSAAF